MCDIQFKWLKQIKLIIQIDQCCSRSFLQVLYEITAKRYNNRIIESLDIKNKLESSYIQVEGYSQECGNNVRYIFSEGVASVYIFLCEESLAFLFFLSFNEWMIKQLSNRIILNFFYIIENSVLKYHFILNIFNSTQRNEH